MPRKIYTAITILIIFIISTNLPTSARNTDNLGEVKIVIAVTGDLLATDKVQLTAEKLMNRSIEDPYLRVASGYERLFSKSVIENLFSADLTFGNLEEPLAEGLTEKWYFDDEGRPVCEKIDVEPGDPYDGKAYKYNPRMIINAHPAFALALKNIGYDMVSTANNHFSNRASNGIDATIESLRRADLDFVGTIKYDEIIDENNDGYPDNKPYIVKTVKGIKVAFLAFTVPLNHVVSGFQLLPVFLGRLPPADEICSRQVYSILSNNAPIKFNIENFCEGIKEAKSVSDIVLVSTHFGIWQRHEPSILQRKIAEIFLEAGADVIVGHGPHVIQPIEKHITHDGRKCFIIYSLGNFLTSGGTEGYPLYNSLVSFIGFINIIKYPDGKVVVKNITHIPTFSLKTKDGLTRVVIAKNYGLKRAEELVQIVLNGSKLDRILLTQKYLSRLPGIRILTFGDLLFDHWILAKWILEDLRLHQGVTNNWAWK